jgi:2-polyprenyl-3-methyl-5-hydroxy-6-metoxy-1,4-benzoquinol methylase
MTEKNPFDENAREWDNRPGRKETACVFAEQIRRSVTLSGDMDLLEFGCGTALVSMQLYSSARSVRLVDTSRGMLAVAQQKIQQGQIDNMETFCGDIVNLTRKRERFDLIYTLMVLHHVPDVAPLLGSFAALLKPGGSLCIGDLESEDGSFHRGDPDVHRGFDTADLGGMIENRGLAVTDCHTMHTVHKPDEAGNSRAYPLFFLAARKADHPRPV